MFKEKYLSRGKAMIEIINKVINTDNKTLQDTMNYLYGNKVDSYKVVDTEAEAQEKNNNQW